MATYRFAFLNHQRHLLAEREIDEASLEAACQAAALALAIFSMGAHCHPLDVAIEIRGS